MLLRNTKIQIHYLEDFMSKKSSAASQTGGLQRSLSPIHVWAIAFGCIVGWGSFINPGKKFLPNSGVAGTAIAMALGALVMILISFSYAYMVPKAPVAGGEFAFSKLCFGKKTAFICGWFLVAAHLTNVPMDGSAISLIVDGLDGSADILKFGFHYTVAGFDIYFGEVALISAILIYFAYLNIKGVRKAGIVQTIMSSLLVICVFVLFIAGLTSAKSSGMNLSPLWGFDKPAAMAAHATTAEIDRFAHRGVSGVLSAILATFAIAPWAYVGFDSIPQAAEEFNFSFKKVCSIMIVAIVFGFFVYTSNNTVAALALQNWPDRVMAGDWVLLIAAEELLGTFGKVLLGMGVFCAVLSGIMGFYLASSRLMFAMGREGYLPAFFGMVDPRYGTPRNAIIFCMLISLSGPFLGREALGWFVDMSSIGASIAYLFTCASTLYIAEKDKDGTAVLKITAVLGFLFSMVFIILQLVPIPGLSGVHFCRESYIMLVVWTFIGFLFYTKQRKFFTE